MTSRSLGRKRPIRMAGDDEVRIMHLIAILKKDLDHVNAVLFALRRLDPRMVIPISDKDRSSIFIRFPRQSLACSLLRDEARAKRSRVKA